MNRSAAPLLLPGKHSVTVLITPIILDIPSQGTGKHIDAGNQTNVQVGNL